VLGVGSSKKFAAALFNDHRSSLYYSESIKIMEWANYISRGVPPHARGRKLIGGNWKCNGMTLFVFSVRYSFFSRITQIYGYLWHLMVVISLY
jgi:hypothetical protein